MKSIIDELKTLFVIIFTQRNIITENKDKILAYWLERTGIFLKSIEIENRGKLYKIKDEKNYSYYFNFE